MPDQETQTVSADEVADASSVLQETAAPGEASTEPLYPPNQVIESSRKLDTHLSESVQTLRRGSLSAKIGSLADEMADFNAESHKVVDGIREKVARAREKRDEAAAAQHAHYDGLINDWQDSIDSAERLSNIPLGGRGG